MLVVLSHQRVEWVRDRQLERENLTLYGWRDDEDDRQMHTKILYLIEELALEGHLIFSCMSGNNSTCNLWLKKIILKLHICFGFWKYQILIPKSQTPPSMGIHTSFQVPINQMVFQFPTISTQKPASSFQPSQPF